MIKTNSLTKRFGDLVAVDRLDLEVKAGEVFGLLGPNGAGKSTTIHLLVGALRADAGTITIADLGEPTRADVRARIGVAPQRLSLYEDLTAVENLRFFAALQGLSGAPLDERVAWGLATSGLEDRGKKRVKTFSGGMQRRLNLACALLHEPDVVFLDEPTAGVDPQSRARLFETVEAARDAGRTVVYTTHQMDEAERLCDRVAIMDHGKLLDIGTPEELIARHGGAASVTARLLDGHAADAKLPGPVTDGLLAFTSTKPLEDLLALERCGHRLGEFKVERADLETVFLTLTGRRLRD